MSRSLPAEAGGDWTVFDSLAAAAVSAVVVVIACSIRTHFHGWGDDFALYVMQGKAIDAGSLNAEVLRNRHMLELSDVQVGPPAAPWGFPVMLWLAAKIVGWRLNELKVVGILSLGVFAGSAYVLARNYLSRLGSVTAAIFLALQPPILSTADGLGSDGPFLAVSGVALVAGEWFVRSLADGKRIRLGLTLVASILAVAAFSIRSQGAFVPASIVSVVAYSAITSRKERRRALIYELLVFTIMTLLLVVLYFRVFPDGSLGQAHTLTLAPQVLQRRLIEVVASSAAFVPFSAMHRLGLLGPVTSALTSAAGVALVAIGAWRHRERSSGLVVFAVLNLALLLIFPINGGVRYLFPLLMPAVVLCGAGLVSVLNSFRQKDWFVAHSAAVAATENVALVGTVAAMLAIVPVVFRVTPESASSGPLTPVADSLFAFVKAQVPPGKTVSFFKPRALRLFTGRLGIAVTRAENLARADYVILDKRADDGRWQESFQLDRQAVESYGQGQFGEIYHNGQFVVYGPKQPRQKNTGEQRSP